MLICKMVSWIAGEKVNTVLLCWVSQIFTLCRMSVCWMLLCWVSWRRTLYLRQHSHNFLTQPNLFSNIKTTLIIKWSAEVAQWYNTWLLILRSGNTKGGSITVPLTSCLTGLESAVWQLTIFYLFAKHTNPNKSNRRSIVQWYSPPLVFPAEIKGLNPASFASLATTYLQGFRWTEEIRWKFWSCPPGKADHPSSFGCYKTLSVGSK